MNFRKTLCLMLSALMMISAVVPTAVQATEINAAGNGSAPVVLDVEAPTFSVTVPTGLPIYVDAEGVVTTADDVYIVNNSHGSVAVTGVTITAKNGWSTVDVAKNLANEPVNTQEFSMTINNETTTGADAITFDQSNWPAIAAVNDSDTDQFHLVYDADVAPQTNALNKDIADVVFTIGWNTYSNGAGGVEEGDEEESGPEGSLQAPSISGVIPEGGFYYVGVPTNNVGSYSGASEVLTAGQEFPDVVKENDVYVQGDYEYRYNKHTNYMKGWEKTSLDGWGVALIDKNATTAGIMYESINGVDIKSLECCFQGAKVETISDEFITPSNVEDLYQCFAQCSNLTYVSKNFYIPDSVTRMPSLFSQCTKLTTAPKIFTIPEGITTCQNIFYGCTALTTLPDNFTIPASVTDISYMFFECKNLTGSMIINTPMLSNYKNCFTNACTTSGTFEISGLCPQLKNIAATCSSGKVVVAS